MAEVPPPAAPTLAGPPLMSRRFRQFLPVVVDVETGGFNCATDALLEIAAVIIQFDPDGRLQRGETHCFHVRPFEGSNIEAASLAVNGIDPYHPLRPALPEKDALGKVFTEVRAAMKAVECRRAVLVGHNAAFDLGFLNAAVARAEIKRNPFHPFSCFDTATLAGAAFGQTVLAKAAQVCGLTGIRVRRIPRNMMPSALRMFFARYATRSTANGAGRKCAPMPCGSRNQNRRPRQKPVGPESGSRPPLRYLAPASVSNFLSSPLLCRSSTISQPPTSSPFTYNCG